MRIRKTFFFIFAALTLISLNSCKDDEPMQETQVPAIRGTIAVDRQYGDLQPDFTAQDMLDCGFDYGDIVRITIGKNIDITAPFVTAYTQAGIMGFSCCDYGKKGGILDVGIANGNFHERVGGEDGDSILITIHEKGGYLAKYSLLQGAYDNDRSHYTSDAVFANFREVTTTGVGEGKLYRGSNPLNADKNPVRFQYMDDFARQVGIQTEIDLADDDEMIEAQLQKRTDGFTYCRDLYNAGHVIGLKMSADTFNDEFKMKLADGLRFMISHEPPYLIHCNEGKDRCGYVALLLEALMGATVEEMVLDYMVTFENYYDYQPNSDTWLLNKNLTIDRMLQLLIHEESLSDITKIQWQLDLDGSDTLVMQVSDYLKDNPINLSEEELDALKNKLK